MKKKNKEKVTAELLSQLHEQFAKNDNDKSQIVISLISCLAFVFAGYGYTFWNYNNQSDILCLITIASCIVLSLLSFLCVCFGYSTRRDQIIIYKIRKIVMDKDYENIFGKLYYPYHKKPLNYLVSHYLIVFVFVNISILVLCMATGNRCENIHDWGCIGSIVIFINFFYFCYKYSEYQNIKKRQSYCKKIRTNKKITFNKVINDDNKTITDKYTNYETL